MCISLTENMSFLQPSFFRSSILGTNHKKSFYGQSIIRIIIIMMQFSMIMNPFEPTTGKQGGKDWGRMESKNGKNFSLHQKDHCDEIPCSNEFFNAPDGFRSLQSFIKCNTAFRENGGEEEKHCYCFSLCTPRVSCWKRKFSSRNVSSKVVKCLATLYIFSSFSEVDDVEMEHTSSFLLPVSQKTKNLMMHLHSFGNL